MKQKNPWNFLVIALLVGVSATASQAEITIQTTTVGDIGNAADTTTYGAVSYVYQIGTTEVTNTQYTVFLNAVASTDSYLLYNANMNSNVNGGITQSGSNGTYTYSVKTGMGNKPVNYVSFWDAARFVNWLSNGQGGADTINSGSYTLSTEVNPANTAIRNAGATWVVTSEDEWYKAAYYKGGSTSAAYWTYPTLSNSAPGTTVGATANQANYNNSQLGPIDVGSYSGSASAYGTFDQGGNLWEWNDTIINTSNRGQRGGAWGDSNNIYLQAADRESDLPSNEVAHLGFRVASIPEPSSLILLLMIGGGWLGWRLRKAIL